MRGTHGRDGGAGARDAVWYGWEEVEGDVCVAGASGWSGGWGDWNGRRGVGWGGADSVGLVCSFLASLFSFLFLLRKKKVYSWSC